MRWTFAASDGSTSAIFFKRRMRFGDFVPSKCRLPECMRITLPVAVTLNLLAAPRCVFNFIFLTFLFFDINSDSSLELIATAARGSFR